MLWIAFRIQYLWYQQQLRKKRIILLHCCELLSEFSIFDTNNNAALKLQSLIVLWIAFRIQYLWYQQQRFGFLFISITCCELLSEFSIFDTNNNVAASSCCSASSCELLSEFSIFDTNNNCNFRHSCIIIVVNCFQNSVSLIPTTTIRIIVFICSCCELLSEFSIFDTNNNYAIETWIKSIVVNCFQNSVSLIPTTTTACYPCVLRLLWIAFRIQYLWYQQQHI